MAATARIIGAVLAICSLTAGTAYAEPGGTEPPPAVPADARADTAAFGFPIAAEAATASAIAAPLPPRSVGWPASVGGSAPALAVPPNASAQVHPLVFSVVPIDLAAEPTIADVSVKREGRALRFTLAADVLFDFDKADLRPEADTALHKFLSQLARLAPQARLRIEGHTDGKGPDPYNDRLALQRAQSVKAWLSSAAGLASSTMTATGFGKRRPVVPNTKPDGSDDPDGRQRNRRVEIVVLPL